MYDWIDSFLTAAAEEWQRIDLAQRRRPELGVLYAANADLFSLEQITKTQRLLAGAAGVEERRLRSVLEFLARGRALAVAAKSLDERLAWDVFGAVEIDESRIPHRRIPAALRLAADPERRRAIEEAHLSLLDDQRHLAEDFLDRQREGIAELGYGSHVTAYQILGNVDLLAIARDGERFLNDTQALYFELLEWHLPRVAGVELGRATAADATRLEAAVEYDSHLPGGDANRRVIGAVAESGLDPVAEGRLQIEWETYLGGHASAVCRAFRVPDSVWLAVAPRSGRPALSSFLSAYGQALHHAYTDPDLPIEQRRLGDESVPLASGGIFESLLSSPAFLTRLYDFPRSRMADYLRLSALCTLLAVRREVARLHFGLAFYDEGAGDEVYAEILTEATGFRHDAREAVWRIDPEFGPARRLRAAQLAAIQTAVLRNRFDVDWFRNPSAGVYLREQFSHGRRFSAQELAVQLGARKLGFEAVLAGIEACMSS